MDPMTIVGLVLALIATFGAMIMAGMDPVGILNASTTEARMTRKSTNAMAIDLTHSLALCPIRRARDRRSVRSSSVTARSRSSSPRTPPSFFACPPAASERCPAPACVLGGLRVNCTILEGAFLARSFRGPARYP